MFSPSRRHYLSTSLALSVGLFSTTVQSQILGAVALNRSGRYRSLSQRSVKLYAQQILDVHAKQAAEDLKATQQLLQASTTDLAKAKFSGATALQYQKTAKEARELTELIAQTPTREKLSSVNTNAEELLMAADSLTVLIEQTSKHEGASLLNLAARQIMLSQRMAKDYFLAASGLDSSWITQQLSADRADFSKALQTLASAPFTSTHIKNDIELARVQWLFFEQQLLKKADAAGLQTVATTSERIFEMMVDITDKYEASLHGHLNAV